MQEVLCKWTLELIGFNKSRLSAATGGLPPPVGPLTTVSLDFINETKNDINRKKANTTATTTTEIFKCYKKRAKQAQGQKKPEAHAIISTSNGALKS